MAAYEPHPSSYGSILTILETVWGDGFMSPGGAEEIALLLQGLDLTGRDVLDVGCGVGGIDLLLVRVHGARCVVGVDVEDGLVQAAASRAAAAALSDRLCFRTVEPGPLPFADGSFDVVFSKDAILHIADKEAFFREVYRVLRWGGLFVASDWMRSDDNPPSPAMERYVALEGLGFGLGSMARSRRALERTGFVGIETLDRHAWYQDLAYGEVERLSGPLYAELARCTDRVTLDREIAVWRAMLPVLDAGELRPGHLRARRAGV